VWDDLFDSLMLCFLLVVLGLGSRSGSVSESALGLGFRFSVGVSGSYHAVCFLVFPQFPVVCRLICIHHRLQRWNYERQRFSHSRSNTRLEESIQMNQT